MYVLRFVFLILYLLFLIRDLSNYDTRHSIKGTIPDRFIRLLMNLEHLEYLYVIIFNINIINQYHNIDYYSGGYIIINYLEIFLQNLEILKTYGDCM